MALFKFGKSVKPQQFAYIPRFYDPAKEAREERIRAAMGSLDNDPDAVKARISQSFRQKTRGSKTAERSASRRSNLILVVTLVGLIAVTYHLLSRYLPLIERWLQ